MDAMIDQRIARHLARGVGEAGGSGATACSEKMSMAHSAMLVVVGSSGCWFLLGSLTRWMFF